MVIGVVVQRQVKRLVCVLGVVVVLGCGEDAPPVDDAPFRQAIVEYLESRNMALKVRDIREGPTVDGETASLSASLTHQQLGGPSVTWELEFARQPDGSWVVTSHED